MSLWIECPQCGSRPVHEFAYGEVPVVPKTLTDPDQRDLYRGFMHSNVQGPVQERWFHAFGCRRWCTVTRDTATDSVLEVD